MARVVEGSARMVNNDALEDDEVAEGWVLTCQALPTSGTVRVVYDVVELERRWHEPSGSGDRRRVRNG